MGQSPIKIQTTLNTGNGASEYLGPNATALFYDPNSGNIIAKIENLSGHDYGCTTVEVDRAGTSIMDWVLGYKITEKTIKITPTTNNVNGNYNITLYYTAPEKNGFTSTITSMAKGSGSISTGNAGLYAEVESQFIYGSDFAYKAMFTSGFSGFGLSNAAPIGALSVALISFKGNAIDNGNELLWLTSTETNNSHFVIERSMDGKAFQEIASVTGKGNTNEESEYNYLDKNPEFGINYYRLKDVSFDGKINFSKTIAIKTVDYLGLTFSPNPAKDYLNLKLKDGSENIVAKVYNILGQLVYEKSMTISNGTFKMDINRLTAGVYQVVISSKTGISKIKFIKQ